MSQLGMFKILSNSVPAIKTIYPSNLALIKPRNLPLLGKIKSFVFNPNENVVKTPVTISTPIVQPALENTTIAVPFEVLPEAIQTVEIGGIRYSPYIPTTTEIESENITPTVGTFYSNPVTQTISLTLVQKVYAEQPIIAIGYDITFATNEISLPTLFKDFPNITGSISISQNFNQHPSVSLNIICDFESRGNIESLVKNFKRRIDIYGLAFRVSNYSVLVKPRRQYPNGEYEISAGLEGWWSFLSSEPISYFNDVSNPDNSYPFADPLCRLLNSNIDRTRGLATSPYNFENYVVTASQLAARAGVDYRGRNFSFPLPKTTPREAVTSFGSALTSDRLAIAYSYIEYSDAVYTRPWTEYKTYNLSEAEVWNVSEQNRNYPIKEKTEIVVEEIPETVDATNQLNALRVRPRFEYNPPAITTSVSGDKDAHVAPARARTRNVDACFDISGLIKERGTKIMQGDSVLRETREVFGFAYIGKDFNEFEVQNGKDISNFWKKIEVQQTDYTYDPKTGYLLGSTTTGFKLQRFLQESPQTMETYFQIKPEDAPDVEPYKFQSYPIVARTAYLLREYFGIYKDAEEDGGYIEYQECNDRGFVVTKIAIDPNWIRTRFVSEELTEYICFDKMVNPANREAKTASDYTAPYYLTTGEEKYSLSKIKVFPSPNTRHEEVLLQDMYTGNPRNPGKEDKYIRYTSEQNAGDANYVSSGRSITEEIISGKPPEALRKTPNYEIKDSIKFIPVTRIASGKPNRRLRYFVSIAANECETKCECEETANNSPHTHKRVFRGKLPPETSRTHTDTRSEATRFITNSVGVSTEEAKLNGTTPVAAGKNIVEFNAQINYFQNNEVVSLTTFFDPYKRPGNVVSFPYAFKQYEGRIIANTSTINIIDSQMVVGETQLTIGSNKEIRGTLSQEFDNRIPYQEPLKGFDVIDAPGSAIGNLVSLSVPSRLNF